MARAESKMIMGYLPLEERHCPAFLWQAGHAAMLVRPTRSAGGVDLLTVPFGCREVPYNECECGLEESRS
ncbi:MAG: hypothetical protein IPK19_00125 [Chloroflexi bacterium]|nr:hypothetical protein [Chloroflexota bacterium]